MDPSPLPLVGLNELAIGLISSFTLPDAVTDALRVEVLPLWDTVRLSLPALAVPFRDTRRGDSRRSSHWLRMWGSRSGRMPCESRERRKD